MIHRTRVFVSPNNDQSNAELRTCSLVRNHDTVHLLPASCNQGSTFVQNVATEDKRARADDHGESYIKGPWARVTPRQERLRLAFMSERATYTARRGALSMIHVYRPLPTKRSRMVNLFG